MNGSPRHPSRRDALKAGVLAGFGLVLGRGELLARGSAAFAQQPLITKVIPSTGERIPVVGIGTNRFGVQTAEEMAPLRDVLRRLPELGGSVVDTAPGYGRSEEVIGQLLAELGNREQIFLATKVTAPNDDIARGRAMIDESFRRLRTDRIDLLMVHNLNGVEPLLPVLREQKQAGRIRYYGISTSSDRQYDQLMDIMRREPLDFVQVDYSITNRTSADRLLPLAEERGMAVLNNVPFNGPRGNNLIAAMGDRPLPDFAAEIGATSWAQFFLSYNVSHPTITAAIPGTTRLAHVEDNHQAARGVLPDAAMRQRMVQYIEANPPAA